MNVEKIEFKVDANILRGKLYVPEHSSKDLAVLFIHGWTGRPNEAAAEFLAVKGYVCMTFSLSGHNDSDGTMEAQTREKSLKEATEAYDLFVGKMSEKVKICVAGNSYGGYMAALLTAMRSIASLHMRVPANYPDERSNEKQLGQGNENPEIMKWRHQSHSYETNRALTAVHNFAGPVQIMEAELDDLVPHQTVKNYVNAVSDKSKLDYHLMKGWPHSLGDDPGRNHQYQQILLNWLNKISEQV